MCKFAVISWLNSMLQSKATESKHNIFVEDKLIARKRVRHANSKYQKGLYV